MILHFLPSFLPLLTLFSRSALRFPFVLSSSRPSLLISHSTSHLPTHSSICPSTSLSTTHQPHYPCFPPLLLFLFTLDFLCFSFTVDLILSTASGLRSRLGDPLDSSVTSPSACFTTLPSCTVIIVAGFWDNSFKCFDTNSG